MAVKIAPDARQQFIDANGNPYSGGKLFWYAAGSTTKQNTYTDSTGSVPNANPIILDTAGRTPYGVWLTAGLSYKMVLAPSADTDPPASPIFTEDNITGVNDTTTTVTQWVSSGVTPTYVSATSFTLAGDQTTEFHVGRRLQFTVTAGTVYGTIATSAYAALTTVTVTMDAGMSLDSGLSAVNLSILRSDRSAIPIVVYQSIQAQTYTAFTTSGSAPSFTATPLPALTAYVAGQRFRIKFHANGAGADTLNLNGLGAKALKQYDHTGTKQIVIPAINQLADVEYDGTDFVLLDPLPIYITRGHISGLICSVNGSDANNDTDIGVGEAVDSTQTYLMRRSSTLTKQLDVNWAAGTNAGGLDTGAKAANTWYYVWLIRKDTDGTIDALYSTSATAPTMPAGYTAKRIIHAVRTDGSSNIIAYHAYENNGGGIDYAWDAPTLDVSLANTLTTSRRTDVLKVPTAFSTVANISVDALDASGSFVIAIVCPDVTDAAPSASVAPGFGLGIVGITTSTHYVSGDVRTDATGAVASRATVATIDTYRIFTNGFRWSRR